MSTSYKLRSYESSPPGQYFYRQEEGLRKNFGPVPAIEDLAKAVAAFRRGNNLPRGSLAESLLDVEQYTCARLGNSGQWCIACEDAAPVPNFLAAPTLPTCNGCGAKPTQ